MTSRHPRPSPTICRPPQDDFTAWRASRSSEWLAKRHERLIDALKARMLPLVREWVPRDAHGQVSRVAARFALVGVAGELASEAGHYRLA